MKDQLSATLRQVNCDGEPRPKVSNATHHEKQELLCLKLVEGVKSTLALLDSRADPRRRTEWQVRLNEILGR